MFFIIPNPFSGRFYSSFSPSEGSNSERIKIWSESFGIISNKPFLGTGLGNYSLSIKPSAKYREPIYAHNLYIDIAAETGILNSILWITFVIFSTFFSIKLFKRRRDSIYLGIAVSIVIFSIHSFFETAIFSVHILPLFVILVGLANNKKSEKNI